MTFRQRTAPAMTGIAGFDGKVPTAQNLTRAQRSYKRSLRDRRLVGKLDALMGSVDDPLPPINYDDVEDAAS